jgi:hypothetical protein
MKAFSKLLILLLISIAAAQPPKPPTLCREELPTLSVWTHQVPDVRAYDVFKKQHHELFILGASDSQCQTGMGGHCCQTEGILHDFKQLNLKYGAKGGKPIPIMRVDVSDRQSNAIL